MKIFQYAYFLVFTSLSFAAFGVQNFDIIEDCENCSEYQMESKAKSKTTGDDLYDVLIFSTSTKELKAYTIRSIIESELGFSHTSKYSSETSVDHTLTSEFNAASETLNRIKSQGSVIYTGLVVQHLLV